MATVTKPVQILSRGQLTAGRGLTPDALICQVAAAAASMGASLLSDNASVRRVEMQGLLVDAIQLAEQRQATATKLKNTLVRLGPTFIKGE